MKQDDPIFLHQEETIQKTKELRMHPDNDKCTARLTGNLLGALLGRRETL